MVFHQRNDDGTTKERGPNKEGRDRKKLNEEEPNIDHKDRTIVSNTLVMSKTDNFILFQYATITPKTKEGNHHLWMFLVSKLRRVYKILIETI